MPTISEYGYFLINHDSVEDTKFSTGDEELQILSLSENTYIVLFCSYRVQRLVILVLS